VTDHDRHQEQTSPGQWADVNPASGATPPASDRDARTYMNRTRQETAMPDQTPLIPETPEGREIQHHTNQAAAALRWPG